MNVKFLSLFLFLLGSVFVFSNNYNKFNFKIDQLSKENYYLKETLTQFDDKILLLESENISLKKQLTEIDLNLRTVQKSLKSCTRDSETYKNRWNSCTNVKGFADFWHNEILNKQVINGLFVTNNESSAIYVNANRSSFDTCKSFLHELSHSMYFKSTTAVNDDSVQWSDTESVARAFSESEIWRCEGLQ